MATTYNHAQIGIVDASGNVNVIYPATTGADVSITANSAISSTATTVQALVSALKSGAIYTVSDSTTSPTSGSKYLWSAYKVKSYVDGQISTLNSKLLNFVFKSYLNAVSVQGNNSADFTAPYPDDSFNNLNSVVFCHGYYNTYAEIVTHIKTFNESGVVITVTVGGTSTFSPTIFCLWLSI